MDWYAEIDKDRWGAECAWLEEWDFVREETTVVGVGEETVEEEME